MAEEQDKTQVETPEAVETEQPEAVETEQPEAVTTEQPKQEEAPSKTATPLPEGVHYIWGTGRRKKSVARVRIRPGTGKILVNKREMTEYFPQQKDQQSIIAPLKTSSMIKSWDIWVNVGGGGLTGQAGAIALGLSRALSKAMPELEAGLRAQSLLTRDARMKERKKYGQRGARRKFQFSKR